MGDMTLGLHGGIGLPGGQAYLGDRPTWGTGLPGGQAYQDERRTKGTDLPGRKAYQKDMPISVQTYQGDRPTRGIGLQWEKLLYIGTDLRRIKIIFWTLTVSIE